MPTVTDWIMVIITAVYAVSTIVMMRANMKSANAAREQLLESKRQFDDHRRLEILPYIQFEKTNGSTDYELMLTIDSEDNYTGTYIQLVRMKNIGKGAAKDIEYTYHWDNYKHSYNRGAFLIQALLDGESQSIKMSLCYLASSQENREICFDFRYRDLLENAYNQKVVLRFKPQNKQFLQLVDMSTSSPELMHKE